MFRSHSSGRQTRSGLPSPGALCQNRVHRLSIFVLLLHVHLRSEGSAENAPIAILSLRSAWPAPEARCQNSAKRLSISSSDLHFLFTLPAAESLSKHSLSSCEIIDILSARQRPSDRDPGKKVKKILQNNTSGAKPLG